MEINTFKTVKSDGTVDQDVIELFKVSCGFKLVGSIIKNQIAISNKEETEEMMKVFKKEKEYQEYLETISGLINSISEEINKATVNFVIENLSDKSIIGDDFEQVATALLKMILNDFENK